jgi:hypothetical protein
MRLCKCGKWFYTNDPKRQYCSNDCEEKPKHLLTVKCDYCGKTINRYKSNCKSLIFCDSTCFNEYKKTLHEKRICKQCGKEFDIRKSAIRSSNASGNYCSRECYEDSMRIPESNGYRADFRKVKNKHFSKTQFCVICGTTKDIHIHHIIPFRLTQDNGLNNLIPLCAKHHVIFEKTALPFIESMSDNYELTQLMLNSILRERQMAICAEIKRRKDNDKQTTDKNEYSGTDSVREQSA